MTLVYASRTGNIERIVHKLNLPESLLLKIPTTPPFPQITDKFVLLTYTDLLGSVPKIVLDFLENTSEFLVGVAGSGNRNFGNNFCGAAKKISKEYKVPLLAEFELAGNDDQIDEFRRIFLEKD